VPGPVLLRQRVAGWLVAVLAAPLLVVLTAAPAAACSCAQQDLDLSLARADAVFTGEVLRRDVGSWGPSRDEAVYVVRVARVFKGEPAAVQEVVTAKSGASCGLELPGSGSALVFADTEAVDLPAIDPGPGQLTATMCGGSRAGAQVPPGFGPGRPAALTTAPGPAAAPWVRALAGGGPGGVAGLAVAVLAAVTVTVAVAVVRRPGRARRPPHSSA
jgi:hypothetical protein